MVWQKAHLFTLDIYKTTKTFPKEELYGLTSQLRRSSSSIGLNIAEGTGRVTNPDLARFLQISFASAQETEYNILQCKDLEYIDFSTYNILENQIVEIKKMLSALIKSVRTSCVTTK